MSDAPTNTGLPESAPARKRKVQRPPSVAPQRRRLLAVAAVLGLLGAAALGLKLWVFNELGIPSADGVRRLSVQVTWHAMRSGAELRVATPLDTPYARTFASQALHPGMRLLRVRHGDGARELRAIATREGVLQLAAQFDLHLVASGHGAQTARSETLKRDELQRYLGAENGINIADPEVARALRSMAVERGTAETNTDKNADTIFRYVLEEIEDAANSAIDGAAQVLAQRRGSALGQARTLTTLARASGLPARVVTGFLLDPPGEAVLHHWAEIWVNDRWRSYDPSQGRAGSVPPWYVPVRLGGSAALRTDDGSLLRARYAVSVEARPQGLPGGKRFLAATLDLTRLPATARDALTIMLLLPLGVLINLLFLSLLRIRTYGTFSATLLALAASSVDLVTAAVLFALVITIAIGGRALMPGLGLSRTPRLSLVFVLVVASMALAVSGMHTFGIGATAGVLLPLVVLTSLTDRVYTVADEQGLRAALLRLAWTALVAVLAFIVFLNEALGRWLLAHPEAHLLTAAAMLAVVAMARRAPPAGTARPQRTDAPTATAGLGTGAK